MGFHHVAVATSDTRATHCFYTEAMGFELVKAVVAPSPEGGWAKHLFYDTGGDGMIAFWELHDDQLPPVTGGLSTGVGLPDWVNHIAFTAVDRQHLDSCRKRWLDVGAPVFEIDHGFCRSIYTSDPDGTLVEWCLDTDGLTDADREAAARVIFEAEPELEELPTDVSYHEPDPSITPPWVG